MDLKYYKMYQNYLVEPNVRDAHNFIFDIINKYNEFNYVFEIGCGRCLEYINYINPKVYFGLDIDADDYNMGPIKIRKRDFDIDNDNVEEILEGFEPLSFVSLFHTETKDNYNEHYKLYNKIFNVIPSITLGLVSGFYYTDSRGDPIIEKHSKEIYQTIENIEDVISDVFYETRFILPVPSYMWGNNVIEVWKLFIRRNLIPMKAPTYSHD